MSSDICPIQWHTENRIFGFGLLNSFSTVATIGATSFASSRYSPTCDNAITAVYCCLQSLEDSSCCTNAEITGNTSLSPTVEINLFIELIPNLVVSKSASSSISSLKPSFGLYHSSVMSSSIWIM